MCCVKSIDYTGRHRHIYLQGRISLFEMRRRGRKGRLKVRRSATCRIDNVQVGLWFILSRWGQFAKLVITSGKVIISYGKLALSGVNNIEGSQLVVTWPANSPESSRVDSRAGFHRGPVFL
jgi:hypothetical protein